MERSESAEERAARVVREELDEAPPPEMHERKWFVCPFWFGIVGRSRSRNGHYQEMISHSHFWLLAA